MTNLVLFAATIALYFGVYYLYLGKKPEVNRGTNLSILAWITLLSLPVNINGHVFTVFGNAVGEKGVYSIASLYQRASDNDGNVLALLSSGYQRASTTFTLAGVSGYQQAEEFAMVGIGASGYQQADITLTFCGLSGHQRAEKHALIVFGVSGYQRAENKASTVVGLAFYQKVQSQSRAFAVWSPLEAEQAVTRK